MSGRKYLMKKRHKEVKFTFSTTMIIAFALAISLVGTSAMAQECGDTRQVFLLDRTSALNAAEESAFDAGIDTLFENDQFGGEIVIGEVRGSSLSFEWIFQTCVPVDFQVSPACTDYFASFDSDQAEEPRSTFTEAPLDWLDSILFGTDDREFSSAERISCQQERASFDGSREESQKQALEAVKRVTLDDVTSSETALAETIFRAIDTQCSLKSCQLYVFSNLLDNNWREVVRNSFDQSQQGKRKVLDAPFFDPSANTVENVLVWGFGFDERDGEAKMELSVEAAIRLRTYWTSFFEQLADQKVSIHFEMPR